MSFYGDVDLDEPSDCEGGSDSSDDDTLNLLLNNRWEKYEEKTGNKTISPGSPPSHPCQTTPNAIFANFGPIRIKLGV